MKKQKFKVGRTPEGTAFELVFIVLAILVWLYVILTYNHAPETIPTHFGPTGAPDSFGHKSNMLFPCILMSVIGASMMLGAYFPHTVNLPAVKIVNERQAALVVRMMRVLGLLMLVLTAALAFDTQRGHVLTVFVVLIVMAVVCPTFIFFIYRSK